MSTPNPFELQCYLGKKYTNEKKKKLKTNGKRTIKIRSSQANFIPVITVKLVRSFRVNGYNKYLCKILIIDSTPPKQHTERLQEEAMPLALPL